MPKICKIMSECSIFLTENQLMLCNKRAVYGKNIKTQAARLIIGSKTTSENGSKKPDKSIKTKKILNFRAKILLFGKEFQKGDYHDGK